MKVAARNPLTSVTIPPPNPITRLFRSAPLRGHLLRKFFYGGQPFLSLSTREEKNFEILPLESGLRSCAHAIARRLRS